MPNHVLDLWNQLKQVDGGVRVHEQELTKATDVMYLFNAGLIRVVRDGSVYPAVDLVLSEAGIQRKQTELNN